MVKTLEFQKESNFKKVEANGSILEIPEKWKVFELKDGKYFRIIQGENYPLKELKEEGHPVFGANGIIGYGEKFHYEKPVVVVTCRGSCGSVNLTPPFTFVTHNAMAILPIKNKEVDTKYLYYVLANTNFRPAISGTCQPQITKASIAVIRIPIPPIHEQRKIAHVLTTIDKAIGEVNKAIKKAKRIKKGLMQELLTKGIGHKEFKDTEIGKIPKEWKVLPAKKVCVKITDGTHDTPKPSESGYYLITSKHLKDGKISFSDAYFISEDDFKEINRRSKVDVGDVLFSMIGTIGVTTVIEKDYPLFAIKNVGLFKTGGDLNLAYWLHYYFQSTYSANYIRNNLKGSTQKYIPLWALRKFPIAIPSYQERRRIIQILSKWNKVIELKKAKKEKLERMKKKVMDLLLAGNVRAM